MDPDGIYGPLVSKWLTLISRGIGRYVSMPGLPIVQGIILGSSRLFRLTAPWDTVREPLVPGVTRMRLLYHFYFEELVTQRYQQH